MSSSEAVRVGYVIKRFPHLSGTFVVNELLALERHGVPLEVFSLHAPREEPRHAMLGELRCPITYLDRAGLSTELAVPGGLGRTESDLPSLLGAGGGDAFAELPGRSARELIALHLQATTLALLVRARRITHLHAHYMSDPAAVAMLAARVAAIPFSFTARARDIHHRYGDSAVEDEARRRKLAAAAFALTVSERDRAHLRALAPEHAARVHRLHKGVDLERLRPRAGASAGRLVAVGRLVERKGFEHLVEACALLRSAGKTFRCELIGDGPLREALLERIAARDLEGCVTLHPAMAQEKAFERMRCAACVVLPCVVASSGDRDGLPTVLLEAMAFARPVVTTAAGGGEEIVEHGRTGLLVPPARPAALARAIASLLDDPSRARALGRAGRARAERLFSLERNAGRLARGFVAGGPPDESEPTAPPAAASRRHGRPAASDGLLTS